MSDFDSPWKEALDEFFESFVVFYFPEVHAEIDWSRGHESLDKEFQQLVPEAETGRQTVDKLVRVWLRDGTETWVLLHVEVQTTYESDFPERVYLYNARVYERYRQDAVSLVVLVDERPSWRPTFFRRGKLGCVVTIEYPVAKLLDFAGREDELLRDTNPFAALTVAHLKAQETRNEDDERFAWKIRLVRALYDLGWKKERIRRVFRLIDWMMALPRNLGDQVWREIEVLERRDIVPFKSMFEVKAEEEGRRQGREEGLQQGRETALLSLETLLEVKFGKEGLALLPEVQALTDIDLLQRIVRAIKAGASVEELRKLWQPDATNSPPQP